MSSLPLNWARAQIRELCRLENGRAFKPSDWTTTGLPIVRIQNLNNEDLPFNHFAGEVAERYRLRGGELLFAWSGTPGTSFGAHIWRGADAVLNQHIFRVDFAPSLVDKGFFRHAINHRLDELIDVAHGGVGLRHVTKGVFEGTAVLVPPLSEQKRIADKLGSLLARIDACRQRLDRVPTVLRRLRRSVLAAGIDGELTRQWREERLGTDGTISWRESALAELCTEGRVITYGVIKLGDEVSDGVPCLRTSNVRWLSFDLDGLKRIAPQLSAEYGRTVLEGGEVLVNVRGTLGGVAVADESMRGWNVSREVAVVPVDVRRVLPTYLSFWIGADRSQRWLAGVEKGVTYTGINIEDLRTLPVSLPPFEEQREIVRRVEELLQLVDRVDMRHQAAVLRASSVPAAVLAKAFRGELVPQDPSDEPASVMLERLRAQRPTSTEDKRPMPKRRARSRTKPEARPRETAPKKRRAS